MEILILALCKLCNLTLFLYIFYENISKGFRVTEMTQFLISTFSKGHHSVENLGGVMTLVLNKVSDRALYL